jgi:uncharacterized protein
VTTEMEAIAHSEDRPLPTPDEFSKPFWDAARLHELRLQRCRECGTVRYYPRPRCPECLSPDAQWDLMAGTGTVYTFTVVHRPLTRWFANRVPLVCAVIELDEGVRMMSNVVGVDPADVSIGMRVHVTWEQASELITLPLFSPLD